METKKPLKHPKPCENRHKPMATHSLGWSLFETLTHLKTKTQATTAPTRTKALPFCPRKESRPNAGYPGKQSPPWHRTYLAELPLV